MHSGLNAGLGWRVASDRYGVAAHMLIAASCCSLLLLLPLHVCISYPPRRLELAAHSTAVDGEPEVHFTVLGRKGMAMDVSVLSSGWYREYS